MPISQFSKENGLKRPRNEYYAFRTVGFAKFQALQVVDAIANELYALPSVSEELSVIRAKTQFWLNELQAAYHGEPKHPATQDLQNLLKQYPIPEKAWVDIITAVEMDIDKLHLSDGHELNRYVTKKHGSRLQLYAAILSGEAPPHEQLALLGCAIGRLDLLRHPDRGVQVSDSDHYMKDTKTCACQALDGLKTDYDLSLKRIITLGQIYSRELKHPMVDLNPLMKLWLSLI